MSDRRSQPANARLRAGVCLLLSLFFTGCAQMVPQTVQLRTEWPEEVPRVASVPGVPFFSQTDYQCGPAALATTLKHAGVPVVPEQLVDLVYVPARKGSLQVEMLAAPRRFGRIGYQLAPRYADLLREVAAGNPVLVLQDVAPLQDAGPLRIASSTLFTEWHYAVVFGFDYPAGSVHLRSGTKEDLELPISLFENQWRKGGYWAMVTLPPDRIPVTAVEDRWVAAVAAMERSSDAATLTLAYETALRRWPDNLQAAIGLANRHHERGALMEAAAVLRRALQAHPDSVIALNNLAQVVSDQGRQGEALAQAERAMAKPGPFTDAVKETRSLILQRITQPAGSSGNLN